MARQRRDVWICDAPECRVERVDDGDAPEGFSGRVSTVGGSGCKNEMWFACQREHIEPAITWVAELAQQRAWQ